MFYKKKYENIKKEWEKQNRELDNMSARFSKKMKLKDEEIESFRNNNIKLASTNLLLNGKNNELKNKIKYLQKYSYDLNTSLEIERRDLQKRYIDIKAKNRKNISKIANISKQNKKLKQDLEKARQMIIALQEELSLEKKKFKPTLEELRRYNRNKRSVLK